jgi:hypothetical protein
MRCGACSGMLRGTLWALWWHEKPPAVKLGVWGDTGNRSASSAFRLLDDSCHSNLWRTESLRDGA